MIGFFLLLVLFSKGNSEYNYVVTFTVENLWNSFSWNNISRIAGAQFATPTNFAWAWDCDLLAWEWDLYTCVQHESWGSYRATQWSPIVCGYHAILEYSIGQILPWQQEEGNLPVKVVEQSLIVGHVMHAISSFVPCSWGETVPYVRNKVVEGKALLLSCLSWFSQITRNTYPHGCTW